MKGASFVKEWMESRLSVGWHPVYAHDMNVIARKAWIAKNGGRLSPQVDEEEEVEEEVKEEEEKEEASEEEQSSEGEDF